MTLKYPPNETEAIEKFRVQVQDYLSADQLNDDKYLWRWLRARDFDLEKAKSMLLKHLEWKEYYRVDTILEDYEPPEIFTKWYIGGVCGFDRKGCPVWVEPMPMLDAKGLLHSVTKHEIMQYKIYTCEKNLKMCEEQSQKLGTVVDQIVVLFDLEGLAWKHLWKPGMDLLKAIICMYEDNYPERLKLSYIIHAPKAFQLGYNMIKPVLSKRTTEKVQILGADWRQKLQKTIPADQLSVHLGGTQTGVDGDEYLLHKVLYGGDIPKSYYMSHAAPEETTIQESVPRRGQFLYPMEVPVEGCRLKWHFTTESHDIGFELYVEPSHEGPSNGREVLVPLSRVNSHLVPETGQATCNRIGKYVFCFDNSYSWTRSKVLHYSVEVLPPEGEDV